MDHGGRRHVGLSGALGLLLGVYVVGMMTTRLVPGAEQSTWWTEVGVSTTLLMLTSRRHWPVLLGATAVAFVAVHLSRGDPVGLSDVLVLSSQPLVAGLTLTVGRGDVPLRLETQRDFVRVLLAATAAGTVALAGASLLAGDPVGWDIATLLIFLVPVASALIAISVAAAFVTDRTLDFGRLLTAPGLAVQTALTIGITVVVFAPSQQLAIAFSPLPLLIWGAARYGAGVAAGQVAIAATICVYFTERGWGPFGAAALGAGASEEMIAALAHSWNLAAVCVTLPLAIAVQEQHALTARLRHDEELFRRSFTEALVGMVFLHRDGGRFVVDDANDAGCRMLGLDPEDLVGRTLDDVVETEASDLGLRDLLIGRTDAWLGRTAAVARPGSRLNVSITALPAVAGARYAAQLLDVTLENEARRALEASQQLTNATLDTAACLIVVTDVEGTVVRINAATTEISGYPEDRLVGVPVWQTPISPFGEADVMALFEWPDRAGGTIARERLSRRHDGAPLRLAWNSNIVRDEEGRPAYAVLTGIDVTSERSTSSVMTHVLSASVATVLIGVDTDGRITLFNSGAERLLGTDAVSVLGQPFVSLLDPGHVVERTGVESPRHAFSAMVATLGLRAESPPADWTMIGQNEERIIVSMSLSVTRDDLDERLGYLCVARDVTAERRSQEALTSALDQERTVVEQLRALDRAKDEFVSTVSHELRTPVTSIVGYTEMLRDGSIVAPDDEQRPMLDIIARNGNRLIDICGDLLLLSGVDSGSAAWDCDPVDLREVLDAAAETVGGLSEGRDLVVCFHPPTFPVSVSGDRVQLERVLVNLVSNAVKFTEDGGRVDVTLTTAGSAAMLTVADTGMGIPEADHDAVFTRFFRTAHAQRLAIPGTGLGLPIVRAIVEAHAGEITLSSVPGEGTTFRVRVPLLVDATGTAGQVDPPVEGRHVRQPAVLAPAPLAPAPLEPAVLEPAALEEASGGGSASSWRPATGSLHSVPRAATQ